MSAMPISTPMLDTSPAYRRFKRYVMLGLSFMAMLAILLIIWQLRSAHRDRINFTHSQSINFSKAIEAHVRHSIEFTDLSLRNLANAIQLLPADQRDSSAALAPLMKEQGSAYAKDFAIIYIDAKGRGVTSSNKEAIRASSYLDQQYFNVHLHNDEKKLYIGEPQHEKNPDQRIVYISRKIESPSGKFLGVVVAVINAHHFAQVFDHARFSDDVTIALIHRSGKVIARVPDFEASFGQDLKDSILFKEIGTRNEGTFEAISKIDKQTKIYSFRVLEHTPLIVGVGIKKSSWTSSVSANLLIASGGTLLMVTIMLLSAQFTLRAYANVEDQQDRYHRLYDSSHAMEEKLQESEKRLRLIADNLPVIIAYVDKDELFTFANHRFEVAFGVSHESIAGRPAADVVGQEIYKKSHKYMLAALAGESVYFERAVSRHGKQVWDAVTYIPDKNAKGEVIGYFSMVEDITERRKSEESKLLHTLVFEHTSEGMMITDVGGSIISVNPAFSKLSGYSSQDAIGKHLSDLASTRHDKDFFDDIRRCIGQTGVWHGEVWNQHKNGQQYLISIVFNTVCDQDGVPFRRIALFSDITKKKATEELIWKQANFDALTGLPNRRMFHDRLRIEMKKSERSNMAMALVFIDLDHFKEVNDTLGHDLGDALLIETAKRLTMSVRGTDTVARLGGDEFTVILSELNEAADVARIAQQILKHMVMPFELGESRAYISASIGITLYPEDGDSLETLLKNADQAMYAAKQQGRNRFNYFAPFMQEATRTKMMLTNELRSALEQKQLRVVYQPIIELSSGKIHKAEALVRWQHPERGLLNPAEFIGIAEASGLIVPIGDWMFYQAAAEAQRMRQLCGHDFQICVNKSALQFRDDSNHYRDWLGHLEQLQLPANSVIIEITEDALQAASRAVTDTLLAFRDAGMQVSLDDFGTGYSSLLFLKRFDIDYIKIDPSFLSKLEPGSDDVILCEAMIAMAHKLGMKVIAEGVETAAQLAFLRAVHCDFGQGYLFSRPVPADELEGLLQSQEADCG
ncbi:MAG: EAL domain-containing protein [Pseudomonadota bacterium]